MFKEQQWAEMPTPAPQHPEMLVDGELCPIESINENGVTVNGTLYPYPVTAYMQTDPQFTSSFRRNLVQLRQMRGLSQLALARICGNKYAQSIGQLESGKRIPKIDTLEILASALGVRPNELLESPLTIE